MFSLLPLMKGWDYKFSTWTRELTRGQYLEVERMDESGWLLSLILGSSDCYGGCKVSFQGADLRTIDAANIYPKVVQDFGAFVQDPAGWNQLYYQPNPQSTVGAFVSALSPGYQGSTIPYVPTTVVQLYLLPQSTQEKATVSAVMFRVIITNRKQFIRSLRAVIGMPTIQDIDDALLSTGPVDITQKGEFDKKEKN